MSEIDPQGKPTPVTPRSAIIRQGLLRTVALGGIVVGASLYGCGPSVQGGLRAPELTNNVAGGRRGAALPNSEASPATNEPQVDTELDVNCPPMPGAMREPELAPADTDPPMTFPNVKGDSARAPQINW